MGGVILRFSTLAGHLQPLRAVWGVAVAEKFIACAAIIEKRESLANRTKFGDLNTKIEQVGVVKQRH